MINTLKTERGLALPDLLVGAYEFLDTIEMKANAKVYLLDQIATIEYGFFQPICDPLLILFNRHRLSTGGSEKIQLAALLGSFKNAVELSTKSS